MICPRQGRGERGGAQNKPKSTFTPKLCFPAGKHQYQLTTTACATKYLESCDTWDCIPISGKNSEKRQTNAKNMHKTNREHQSPLTRRWAPAEGAPKLLVYKKILYNKALRQRSNIVHILFKHRSSLKEQTLCPKGQFLTVDYELQIGQSRIIFDKIFCPLQSQFDQFPFCKMRRGGIGGTAQCINVQNNSKIESQLYHH